MSRKTLLTEAEVRQFLKLANIGPVGDAKIQEMYSTKHDDLDEGQRHQTTPTKPTKPGQRDDEQMEEGEELDEMYPAARDDEDRGADAMGAMDAMGDAEDDMGDAAMDMGGAPDAGRMVAVEDFMGALERALEDVLGDEVDVDMDDEDDDGDMGDMGDMDDMGDDDPPGMGSVYEEELQEGEPAEEEEDEDQAAAARAAARGKERRDSMRGRERGVRRGIKGVTNEQDEMVAEVARRVAERLKAKNQKQKMVDDLAERIFQKITSK